MPAGTKTRKILTRLSKGELSPLLEGSPDLVGYFEGCATLENFQILRQGGIRRWSGSRLIKEVKDSSKDTIVLPFEFSVDDAYILEVGDLYIRVYKTKAAVLNGGVHVEVVTPFVVADIRSIHMTQSADVLFLFHGSYQQRKLSRVSDTNWSLNLQTASSPPSFEADTDIIDSIALSTNTGTGVLVRAAASTFLAGDIGRQIIAGAARAVITSVTSSTEVVVDILDPFSQTITAGPNTLTSAVTAVTSAANGVNVGDFVLLTSGAQSGQMRKVTVTGNPFTIDAAFTVDQGAPVTWNKIIALAVSTWFLRLSPQVTLDPTIKSPVGAQVTLVASLTAFRAADVGKFINIYGGVIKITAFTSGTTVKGTIMSELGDATAANPPAADAGTWTLEVASWSASRGWPRTGEFYQGRLYQAATASEPTTFWGSTSDDFDNYAVGITAQDAVNYRMAARQVNRIEWLSDHNNALLLGTSGSEHKATGSGSESTVLGGDTIPFIERLATNGCMPSQPLNARRSSLYIDRSRRKVMQMGFDIQSDGESDIEISVGAEHITESGVRLGPLAFEKRLNPCIYFVREDGTLVAMTYFPEQKVVAFSRRVTEGTIESVAVIPTAGGGQDQVWIVAKRTINGATKRFVELFEFNHEGLSARPWTSLQTDCAIVITGLTGFDITGLSHLEGCTVDVIKNSGYVGSTTVDAGIVTLPEEIVATDVFEVGLHYDSMAITMRPAVQGTVIEGIPRSWDDLFARFYKTTGGKLNGEPLQYPPSALDSHDLYTGDVKVSGEGWDLEGRNTILQDKPYPMTMLCVFGTISIGGSS